jgi:hypothetical protein
MSVLRPRGSSSPQVPQGTPIPPDTFLNTISAGNASLGEVCDVVGREIWFSSSFRLRIRFRNARSTAESFDGFLVRDIAAIALTSLIEPVRRFGVNTARSIPRGSIPWVRARRASLALLPQLPRQNKSSTGADVHCTRPRPWRADAQYEGRWASWVLVLSRAAFVLSRATPVGDLIHAGFELL